MVEPLGEDFDYFSPRSPRSRLVLPRRAITSRLIGSDRRDSSATALVVDPVLHCHLDPWCLCHVHEAHTIRWQEANPRPTPRIVLQPRHHSSSGETSSGFSSSSSSSRPSEASSDKKQMEPTPSSSAPAEESSMTSSCSHIPTTSMTQSQNTSDVSRPSSLANAVESRRGSARARPRTNQSQGDAMSRAESGKKSTSRAGTAASKRRDAAGGVEKRAQQKKVARTVTDRLTQQSEAKRMAKRLLDTQGAITVSVSEPALASQLSTTGPQLLQQPRGTLAANGEQPSRVASAKRLSKARLSFAQPEESSKRQSQLKPGGTGPRKSRVDVPVLAPNR